MSALRAEFVSIYERWRYFTVLEDRYRDANGRLVSR